MFGLPAVFAMLLGGCNPSVAPPRLFNPGPAPYQRQRAVQFDPYPDQDAGPSVAGGRPLDYDRQIPEADRSRFFLRSNGPGGIPNPGNWLNRRRILPAPPVAAPPIVVPQAAPQTLPSPQ
jgi:hypothetical protein